MACSRHCGDGQFRTLSGCLFRTLWGLPVQDIVGGVDLGGALGYGWGISSGQRPPEEAGNNGDAGQAAPHDGIKPACECPINSYTNNDNKNNYYTFPVRRLGVHLDHLKLAS
jgi:hypothetical protein